MEKAMSGFINTIETDAEKAWTDIKLDFNKVITILRTYLPGDHDCIREVKKLAGGNTNPESSGVTNASPTQTIGESIVSGTSAPKSILASSPQSTTGSFSIESAV